jgi:heme exporter protein C
MTGRILGVASAIGLAAALYFALVYAPTEQTMGTLQRVFYFHLPQAILSYLAAFLLGFGSLMYLATRSGDVSRGMSGGQEMPDSILNSF